MGKKNLRKICHELQPKIDSTIKELLSECKTKYSTEGVAGYIADTSRGRAHHDGQFTVPLWAYDRRYKGISYHGDEGHFKYYVAHELAHQLRYIKYGKNTDHDFRFYEIFMDVCPKDLQHFELNYKPSSSKYGIKQPN